MNAVEAKLVMLESILETDRSTGPQQLLEEVKEGQFSNISSIDEFKQLNYLHEGQKVPLSNANPPMSSAMDPSANKKVHKREVESIHKILAEELSQIAADRSMDKHGNK